MNTVTISSGYQGVIPRPNRERFNLKPGQKIAFRPFRNTLRVVIVPAIEDTPGMLPGSDTDPHRQKEYHEV